MIELTLGTILLVGGVAGLTIYLGLPIAFVRENQRLKLFLTASSVGILLYLFGEIISGVVEQIESTLKLVFLGYRTRLDLSRLIFVFVVGFATALLGLLLFEVRSLRKGQNSPLRLAFLIAVGIGLHNFSEGLVIGQQLSGGALAFGMLMAVGFALHNATEGFAIAAPLASLKPSLPSLFLLGLIGGGPTFLGTLLGTRWPSSPLVEGLFLSLAAGAILYIVGELIHMGRAKGGHVLTTVGLLAGFLGAFGTDLFIERVMLESNVDQAQAISIQMHAGDFFFDPPEVHVKAGQPLKIVIDNRGEVEHEVEFLGFGEKIEQVIPWRGSAPVLVNPRHSGRFPFICDMPGHLVRGMKGTLFVD